MKTLLTQPNEKRCGQTLETHILEISGDCPVSQNPLPGSFIEIEYRPNDLILEVAALRGYVDSFKGGKGEIRSMEGMIQSIAQDCADAAEVPVQVTASLNINPNQKMRLVCNAWSKNSKVKSKEFENHNN